MNTIIIALSVVGAGAILAAIAFLVKKAFTAKEPTRQEFKETQDGTFEYFKGKKKISGVIKNQYITTVAVGGKVFDSIDSAFDHLSKKQLRTLEALEDYLEEVRNTSKMYDVIVNPFFGDQKDGNKIYMYDLGRGAVSARCEIEIVEDENYGGRFVGSIIINEKDYSYTIDALDDNQLEQFAKVLGASEYKEEWAAIQIIKERLDHYSGLVATNIMTIDDKGKVSFKLPVAPPKATNPSTTPQQSKSSKAAL